MKTFVAAALSLTVVTSGALAETAPLAPGKPAGIRQANMTSETVPILVGIAAVVAVAIAVNFGSKDNNQVTPTTGTAS